MIGPHMMAGIPAIVRALMQGGGPNAGGGGAMMTPPADPWAPNASPGFGDWPFVPPLDTGFGENPGVAPWNPVEPFVPQGMKPPGYARVPTMGRFPTFFGTQVPGSNNTSVFPTSWSLQQTPNGSEWVPRAQAANPTPAMEGPGGIGPQANIADSAGPGTGAWWAALGVTNKGDL